MLDFLGQLFSSIFGFLADHLPDSPVQQWIAGFATGGDELHMGLGYLNWVCPVGDLIGILTAYIALLAIWIAVRAILGKTEGIAGKLI